MIFEEGKGMIILSAKVADDHLVFYSLKNIRMQIKNITSKLSSIIVNLYYRVFF
jgi:hypothetical protein